ncbi:MAG: hypothetical protein ACRDWY_02405, partial [Actinomycetes bacterium]
MGSGTLGRLVGRASGRPGAGSSSSGVGEDPPDGGGDALPDELPPDELPLDEVPPAAALDEVLEALPVVPLDDALLPPGVELDGASAPPATAPGTDPST